MTALDLAGHIRANRARLDGKGRLAGVDLARGLAVVGMLAAHLLAIAPWSWSDPATWAGIAQGRSSVLFATLAGLSLGLVAGGYRPLRGPALASLRLHLLARAMLLWLIGIVLATLNVPVYVILPAYAILFLVAIPALGLGTRALVMVAAGTAAAAPLVQAGIDASPWRETNGGYLVAWLTGWHYPFLVWSAFVLGGLVLARIRLDQKHSQIYLLVGGLTGSSVGYMLDALLVEPRLDGYWADAMSSAPHSSGLLEVVGSGGFAVAAIGLCLLLGSVPRIAAISLPLRAVGSMPLTAYTLQILAWALVASVTLEDPGSLNDFRSLHPFWPFMLGTLAFCTAWALLIGRGPLETALIRLNPGSSQRETTSASPPPPTRRDEGETHV
ncbi:DUF418 domain-containing protein [Microbacterium maritypicum]|uniref:DUF418 domain-containing protein n=1 Tax=Microbacterium maritypicum TaxID=33918 RepID=UPI002672E9E3|nr:DUF418 domain-containing protein [Microbacterium liquefaciens]WKT89584.1 DUF418 domain-containing protein [Microbacterium liquefaciens]